MTENRTPKQISNNLVLCEDNTIWKLSSENYSVDSHYYWEKLPQIPTDEEYENLVENREDVKEKLRKKHMEKKINIGLGDNVAYY